MKSAVKALEEYLKGYLDDFFKKYDKDYNYSLDIKIEKYFPLEKEEKINRLMLSPCEVILHENKKNMTDEILERLKSECINKDIKWDKDYAESVIVFENKCNKTECYKSTTEHIEEEKDEMIIIQSYKKVTGTKDKFYIVSFMVDKTSFSKEMLDFYKFYIQKILDMFQFNLEFNLDKNIFIDAREEYKVFLTKSFLSFLLEEQFNYENSYQIIENLIMTFKLNYEKQKTVSRILISDEISKSYFIEFEKEIDLTEIKKGRKLLELCKNDNLYLHLQKGKYKGICEKSNFKSYIEIQIKENQGYTFKVKNEAEEREFHIKNHNIAFDVKDPQQYFSKLKNVLKISKQQTKGTMVIVLQGDKAKIEGERLGHTGIKTKELKVTEENILNITSIDGALILDENLNCFGMGIILDTAGQLNENIDRSEYNPARGARYNSAVRYKEFLKAKDISHYILVVSEDGDVFKFEYFNKNIDLFKNLKEKIQDLYNRKDYKSVVNIYNESINIFENIKKHEKTLLDELGSAYNIIGISFSELKNSKKAIELYNLALVIKWENTSIYNNLAVEYLNNNNPNKNIEKGFEFYRKSIETSRKLKSQLGKIILNNIYSALIRGEEGIDISKWLQDVSELFLLEDLESLKVKLKEENKLELLKHLEREVLLEDKK